MDKIISEFPDYLISDNGDVFSIKKNKYLMTPKIDRDGYLTIGLRYNGTRYWRRVHRLVAQYFIPNPDNKPCVNHINGKVNDNNVSNLEWCTISENTLHGFRVLNRVVIPTTSKKCSLFFNNIHVMDFNDIKSAALYASNMYGVSKTSLIKHYKSKQCHLKCND